MRVGDSQTSCRARLRLDGFQIGSMAIRSQPYAIRKARGQVLRESTRGHSARVANHPRAEELGISV
jgi:hypothetical protein